MKRLITAGCVALCLLLLQGGLRGQEKPETLIREAVDEVLESMVYLSHGTIGREEKSRSLERIGRTVINTRVANSLLLYLLLRQLTSYQVVGISPGEEQAAAEAELYVSGEVETMRFNLVKKGQVWQILSYEINGALVAPSPPTRRYDYNGDGTPDVAIFRPSSGLWAVRGVTRAYFGAFGDLPVPGDYNGDGTSVPAVFRAAKGLWAIRGWTRIYFGAGNDYPVPADYNGDGTIGIALFRPSSGVWVLRGISRVYFGKEGDRPVPGDYSGAGSAQIGIFRESNGFWALRGLSRFHFGQAGDLPAAAEYDVVPGLDPGIFRPASGLWAVAGGERYYYGKAGDLPVPAGYNGGPVRAGIFRPPDGLWGLRGLSRFNFGRSGDIPVTR